jgi:hypothetical protein
MRTDYVVILLQSTARADGYGLFASIQVNRTRNEILGVKIEHFLFEDADL